MSNPLLSRAILLSALLVSSLVAGAARADEFTVSVPTVVQNGGYTIDGDDTLTITGLGSITTSADLAHAVNSNGAANTVVINDGTVETQGSGAAGVYGSNSANMRVTNNGDISTTGLDGSYGIYVKLNSDNSRIINNGTVSVLSAASEGISIEESDGSSIENYGTVTVTGVWDYGLSSEYSDNSSITNAGLVSANGQFAIGINIGDSTGSAMINSGAVDVGGFGAYGLDIWNSTGVSATNSGSILTTGEGGFGLANETSADSQILNTGTIRTSGVGAHGIFSTDSTGGTVSNSGLVVADRGDAIFLDDSGATLNLSTAGYLGGGIRFEQAATVNITTAASHSVLWDFSDGAMAGGDPASISGDAPWFYNSATKQFATYDPSVLAGAFDELGDMTGLLSDVGRATRDGGVWGASFGGMSRHDGDGAATLDRDVRQFGFAFGYDGAAGEGARWGVMGGFLHSELAVDSAWASSYAVDGNGWFAGVNGARDIGAITIDAGVAGGRIGRDATRFVNDNTALTGGLTLGEGQAAASYGGWFLAPELGVSATLGSPDGWSMTPGARLRYAGQWTQGFTETGSAANATVDALALGLFEASAEVALARGFGSGSVSTRLGYRSRQSVGDAATVTLVGETNAVGLGDVDSEAAYAGLGMDVQVAPGMRLNLDVTGYYGAATLGGQASAKIAGAF